MSGLARKSTHAKGGKKRRAAIENVKCPVGVVGEPSEVKTDIYRLDLWPPVHYGPVTAIL